MIYKKCPTESYYLPNNVLINPDNILLISSNNT